MTTTTISLPSTSVATMGTTQQEQLLQNSSSYSQPASSTQILLNSNFARELKYLFFSWPLLWVMGIEQFILPLFFGYALVKHLLINRGVIAMNRFTIIVLAIAAWWLVPVQWVERSLLHIFVKDIATFWSFTLAIFLFSNQVRTHEDREHIFRGLDAFAFYNGISLVVFITGLWQGQLHSLLGLVVGSSSRITESIFFSTVIYREFGTTIVAPGSLFQLRFSGLAINYSSMSMICLLLIPYVLYRLPQSRNLLMFLMRIGTILAIGIGLVVTDSRLAYLAAGLGFTFGIFVWLTFIKVRLWESRIIFMAFLLILASPVIYGLASNVFNMGSMIVQDYRPGSWLVRQKIYTETLNLLFIHPIAGWGTSVRIEGLTNNYSAGTHSAYLGVLFQHGIIGLLLYLIFLGNLWQVLLTKLHQSVHSWEDRNFWWMCAVAIFCINVRETGDVWWWDQSLSIVLWSIWGLAIASRHSETTYDIPYNNTEVYAGEHPIPLHSYPVTFVNIETELS